MRKIKKTIASIILLAFLAPSLVGCGNKLSASGQENGSNPSVPKQINFGILRVPNDEAIAISQKIFDKYFTEKGIKCNFIVFDSGVEANKAFASGSIDFASMGHTNAVVALSTGLDVELIWIHEVLGEIEALAVKESSNVNSIEELAGKKIATPFASTSHYSLLNAIKNAGIEDKVELLDMQTADIVAAWERGDIEAAYTWQPSLGKILKDGKVIINSEEMANQGYVTANVKLVRKKFAEQYPDLVASLIACLAEGSMIYRQDSNEGANIVAKELEIEPQDALEQMKGSIWLSPEEKLKEQYLGNSDSAGKFAAVMKDTADFLAKQGFLNKVPSQEEFSKFINSSYIEEAIKILK
ncbi:glycine betaine ABC transporter substrate-binding protein [Proteiniborus sp. MB09-C3]|uniref:taurine ABC transporter substrate-binding protein n=1 Tax=Proteiniborus sp. MB09-C3 TaxID=3050072 RepID=UPI002555CDC1|nr:glycine betaine ABC transporter substrate-binding protein [Proteiniborus sp. MB09-C3]WIV12356.1 MetQ/NlpA family ABC transporter substrate-binding protein [Proteiniborus sp. MB09-C3]